MENEIKFEVTDETSGEQNSIFLPESHSMNTVMEITNAEFVETSDTEFDQSTVDMEVNTQQGIEISPGLEKENIDAVKFLFAPFNHRMRPDPELVRLELEKSALDQAVATKLINDRYELIMEASARRKEKEQRDKMKYAQISQKIAQGNVLKTTQFSHHVDGEAIKKTIKMICDRHVARKNVAKTNLLSDCVDSENIKKTTQLLNNLRLTSSSLPKNQSEAFSDNHQEKIFWHNGLRRFIKLNYSEINTTANVSSTKMLSTVTEQHKCRVRDALNHVWNEQKDGVKRMAFFQASQKLANAKHKKTTQIFKDEFVGASFEDLLDERSGRPY